MLDLIIEISIPLIIIFITVLLLILLTRLILNLTLFFLIKKYKDFRQKRIKRKEKYKKENLPTEDELLKSQKKERENLINIERINTQEQNLQFQNQEKIVDIAKPIGFWTSLILGQKLSYLVSKAQIINNREHKGFWVSMIEAQARGIGRKQGRGI
jgi:hypothetical protein